jgi:hypothetical protein
MPSNSFLVVMVSCTALVGCAALKDPPTTDVSGYWVAEVANRKSGMLLKRDGTIVLVQYDKLGEAIGSRTEKYERTEQGIAFVPETHIIGTIYYSGAMDTFVISSRRFSKMVYHRVSMDSVSWKTLPKNIVGPKLLPVDQSLLPGR